MTATLVDTFASSNVLAEVPFNAIDELCFHLGNERFPWTIEVEVRAPGPIDEARLRAAVVVAAARHPMARARLKPYRLTDRRYDWEIVAELGTDPVRVLRAASDGKMIQVRGDILSAAVPLDQAPPFRVWLVHRPGGDSVILAASHVATDGMGAACLLRSIVRASAGAPDPVDGVEPIDPTDAADLHGMAADRDLRALAGPTGVLGHVERLIGLGGSLRRSSGRLSRIARDGGVDDAAGFSFHHVVIPAIELATLDAKRHTDATINDVLLAALHLAIADWNADHGEPTERISVMMPMNQRPDDRRDGGVGNFAIMASVNTSPDDRDDAETLVRAVASQTKLAKQSRSATILLDVLDRSHLLPSLAKKAIPMLSPLSGDLLIDTAVLSNLGRLTEPFDFGADSGIATEVWFSPPARMPLGVGVGAVTHDGDLHLSFRCCVAQFDAAAADAFATYFRSALDFVG